MEVGGSRWRRLVPADLRPWEVAPALLVTALAVTGIVSAFRYAWPLDLELAYHGGQEAWAFGHPERVITWISTPFLGLIMAIVSRLLSVTTASLLLTVVNLAIVIAALVLTWRPLRGQLPRWAWWLTLIGAIVFAPIASTIWWKQFNIIALGLALVGFVAAQRGRTAISGALIALSILVKPIVVLLPFAMLARRDSRKAGVWSLSWLVLLSGVAQVFMAWRAHDLHNLSPLPALTNFLDRTTKYSCHPENFSPGSLLCRVTTGSYISWQRQVLIAGVLVLIILANDAIRQKRGHSWELFAFACLLSPMVSTTAWSHFQILLLPMFVLLALQFVTRHASLALWIALAAAYLLAELIWRPIGTLPGFIELVLFNRNQDLESMYHVMGVAQFAQYLLFVVAVGWFYLNRQRLSEVRA